MKGLIKMKNGMIRRSVGVIISMILMVGAFASAAITADAALGSRYDERVYTIVIKDVTRKYPDAKVILDAFNAKRSQLGLSALKMDKDLLEDSMVRAAELPVWTSTSSLEDKMYYLTGIEQDNSYYYNEAVAAYNGSASAAAAAILSGDNADAVTNARAKDIGIGVVTVGANKEMFVCVRTTDEKSSSGSYTAADSSVYGSEKAVYQKTTAYGHNLVFDTPYPGGLSLNVGETAPVEFTAKEKMGAGYTAPIAPCLIVGDTSVCSFKDVNEYLYTPTQITGLSVGTTNVTLYLSGLPRYTSAISVTVNGEAKPLANNTTINSDLVTVGTKINLCGAAEGGDKNYTYTYKYKRTTSRVWTTLLTENTKEETACFTPSAAGVFDISVSVKDGKGETAEKNFVLTVADGKSTAFVNNSTVSTTGTTPNTKVWLKGAASGSSGYTYAFYYKRTTARNWTILGNEFGTDDEYGFTPRTEGEFNIKIDVIDKNREIVSRIFALSVNSGYNDTGIVNGSSVSASTVNAGSKLTVSGAASGGTAPYTYAYYYKRAGAANWTTLGDFSTASSKSVTLRTAGDYIVKVAVKDSSGGMISNNFDVTVVS